MASPDIRDDRDESPAERADRNWDELLQELRVMQTGSQILAGFLLAVAFQPRFTELTPEQVVLYLVLVALAGLSTLLALAPVTVHRRYFGQHRKPNVVAIAARFVIADLVVIGALSVGVTTLVFEVTLGRTAAIWATGVGVVIVSVLWLALPLVGGRARRPVDRRRG